MELASPPGRRRNNRLHPKQLVFFPEETEGEIEEVPTVDPPPPSRRERVLTTLIWIAGNSWSVLAWALRKSAWILRKSIQLLDCLVLTLCLTSVAVFAMVYGARVFPMAPAERAEVLTDWYLRHEFFGKWMQDTYVNDDLSRMPVLFLVGGVFQELRDNIKRFRDQDVTHVTMFVSSSAFHVGNETLSWLSTQCGANQVGLTPPLLAPIAFGRCFHLIWGGFAFAIAASLACSSCRS